MSETGADLRNELAETRRQLDSLAHGITALLRDFNCVCRRVNAIEEWKAYAQKDITSHTRRHKVMEWRLIERGIITQEELYESKEEGA